MATTYPEYWNTSKSASFYNKPILIDLDLRSNASQKISNQFHKTVKDWKIIKIEAVQNANLWDKYCNTKQILIKTIGAEHVNERYLFHGTRQNIIPTIITQGCRKEFSTTAAYGEGTYFARDASYSVNYSQEINGIKKFFLCKVICGKMCVGSGSYKLDLWPKQSNGLRYDSLVNRLNDPSIFVIHNDVRVYPMYIIHYKRESNVQPNNATSKSMDDEKHSVMNVSTHKSYPNYWNHTTSNYSKYLLINLSLNSTDGQVAAQIFNKTLSKYNVTKIEAVQNGYLWDQFSNAKLNLIKSNTSNVNEKYLFHATTQKIMDIIITEGFRKEFTHKGYYGSGTYFACDASRSERYAAKTSDGCYKMFLCKVLCGEMCVGKKDITLRNWPKKPTGLIYDSLVDSKSNPSVFVIHDDVRVYAMYIIHFKK
eukprot:13044_1